MSSNPANTVQCHVAEWVFPIRMPPIYHGVVVVQDGKIQAVMPLAEYDPLQNLPKPNPGTYLTPGLVNTHVHLEQSYPVPIPKAEGEDFVDWLLKVIMVTRTQQAGSDKLARCLNGAIESLEAGVTCVNDVISGPESITALQQVGLRAKVTLECFHPDSDQVDISRWPSLYKALENQSVECDRITLGLSPHSPYNVSLRAWKAFLEELNPPFIHSHWGEFEEERRYLAGEASRVDALHRLVLGRSFTLSNPILQPVQTWAQTGGFDVPTILAHAIHLSPSERQVLSQFPVSIAHCPRSNLALHGKTLHWPDWELSSLPMGLGTDGRLSTSDLDLREEARLAMRLHGWSAQMALEILTLGGARVLSLQEQIGSLSPGKQADLVLWQGDSASLAPSMSETLIFEPSTAVHSVWVDGQIRYTREEPL